MRTLILTLSASLLMAVPLSGQQVRTISPGMTAEEVRNVLGAPAVVRDQGEWQYLFYTNRCLPRCGSDDVVFLREGRVAAAVLRSPQRRFAGPPASAVLQTMQPEPGTATGGGGAAPGVRVDSDGTGAVRGIRIQAPHQRREAPVNLGVIRGREPMPTGDDETIRVDTLGTDTPGARDRQPPAPITAPAVAPPPQPRTPPVDTVRGGMRQRPPQQ
jgi:hypothetical protein